MSNTNSLFRYRDPFPIVRFESEMGLGFSDISIPDDDTLIDLLGCDEEEEE